MALLKLYKGFIYVSDKEGKLRFTFFSAFEGENFAEVALKTADWCSNENKNSKDKYEFEIITLYGEAMRW